MNQIPLIPNQMYHIYSHATGEDNFFRSEENYRYFLEKYQQYVFPIVETFAYCLMPNHFHFMIRVRSEGDLEKFFMEIKGDKTLPSQNLRGFKNLVGLEKRLSQQFSNLFNAYSKAYNKLYDRKGSLFRERFRRKSVENDTYYTRLIGYIHNNPVHHGFVEDIQDWTWSSYHAHISNKNTKLEKEEVLDWFGNQKKFIKFHQEYDHHQTYEVFKTS